MQNRQSNFHGASLVLVTVVLAMGNFMEVLDTTIANVSLPSIAGDLGVSSDQGVWVITSYAVANAIAVLLSGWLAQRFGQMRVFVAAVAIFTLTSALCGVAAGFQMLIAARVLQGGVALANTAWERRTALHHSQLVEHIANDSATAMGTITQLEQLGMPGHDALAQIDIMITRQASTLAANDIYWLCGWLFLALIGLVWLARRPFGDTLAAA